MDAASARAPGAGSCLRSILLLLVRVDAPPEERHLLLLNVHHVAFDGASTAILLAELGALYAALAEEGGGGGSAAGAGLAELAGQYVDYALWQRDESLRPLLEGSREYWRSHLLDGALPVLELPLDSPRPAAQTFRGATAAVALSAEVGARLTGVCRQHGCTLFQLVLGVWSLLMCRHAGQDEVVVGSPYHGRDAAGTEALIGYFVNVLALRVEALRAGTVSSLVACARDAASGGMWHALLPFQLIVHELLPRRAHDASRNAVFQAMMAWGAEADERVRRSAGGTDSSSGLGGGLALRPAEIGAAHRVAKVEVTLFADVTPGDGIAGGIEFNTDLFARGGVARLAARLFTPLAAAVDEFSAMALPPLAAAGAVEAGPPHHHSADLGCIARYFCWHGVRSQPSFGHKSTC